ncbi:MAG: alanine--tRNA ligase [Saprospiraceae bacterium]|nr:alanine--tRNA ligase [Saprospiraceae bacterium]
MITVKEIRQQFLNFFEAKGHKIVPSAPIVNQNDPTLMFINSGMAQFKDYFLGNETPSSNRIADTQKCLRVSGKHNDLEDVGRDSYHQTMFEMLGNWSFGDYFKEEAIEWAWELLTKVYKMDEERLYVTVFGGDEEDGVPFDDEAEKLWLKWVNKDKVLRFGKKENFWEMGAQGPCGPCSEIHIDIRSDAERAKVDGKTLVNKDHPQVIEIWNLVFMQFNRLADKSLVTLSSKCIDTGMGLERVCMVMQGKTSNYDTDVFSPFISLIEKESGIKYKGSYSADAKEDIAMRVIADHLRAVSMVIADGQQPSNTGAGYVVRRILRRAVRYYYSFLHIKTPFIYKLLPTLADMFEEVFPEVKAQMQHISNTIKGEEEAFLRTLERGLKLFADLKVKNGQINGDDAFTLFDTFGFPYDLTCLLAEEKGWTVDETAFNAALAQQKARSQKDALKDVSDWVELLSDSSVEFVGYSDSESKSKVVKYRKVIAKNIEMYQIVLNKTPFYAEAGGQVGDTGLLWFGKEKIPVTDTKKENNLIVHWVKKLPANIDHEVVAQINTEKRQLTENNHSVAHLAHAALRQVLGAHVQQKGSFVSSDKMRFDFSHPKKMTLDEIRKVEEIVNAKIRANISLKEENNVPVAQAKKAGAMMLFGEKYGESVRVITFEEGFSKELCGGCHVKSTGQIGVFKIVIESAIAAGIRRIEALTAESAEVYIQNELAALFEARSLLKNPKNLGKSIQDLLDSNKKLKKEIEKMAVLEAQIAKEGLKKAIVKIGDVHFLGIITTIVSKDGIKQLSSDLMKEIKNLVLVLGAKNKDKAILTVAVDTNVVKNYNLNAGNIIKTISKEIQGGGGGQPTYAMAGGKNPAGLNNAIAAVKQIVEEVVLVL